MKKSLITLTVLTSALNIAPISAQEVLHKYLDESQERVSIKGVVKVSPFLLPEIQDLKLRKDIELKLKNLILLSQIVKNNSKVNKSKDLSLSVLGLKDKINTLEDNEPNISSVVKTKILSEMLRTGVVVVDEEESLNQNRVQVMLNESIVEQLEGRLGGIENVAAEGGTVCI